MTSLPTTMSAVAHATYGPPEALDVRAMEVPPVKANEVLTGSTKGKIAIQITSNQGEN